MQTLSALIPLRLARTGSSVEVVEVLGDSPQSRRLHELGLKPGGVLTVLQSGTPCLVKVGRTKLSFRDGEADSIFVRETL